MLHGIRRDLQRRLVAEGYRLAALCAVWEGLVSLLLAPAGGKAGECSVHAAESVSAVGRNGRTGRTDRHTEKRNPFLGERQIGIFTLRATGATWPANWEWPPLCSTECWCGSAGCGLRIRTPLRWRCWGTATRCCSATWRTSILLLGAGVYVVGLDQRYRCRVCSGGLRMPIQTGSWGRMLQFGRPRHSEYICLYGHGTLREDELQISGMANPEMDAARIRTILGRAFAPPARNRAGGS